MTPNDSSNRNYNVSVTSNNNHTAVNNIDSALQSALRDSRERVALLKLEKTLIDFINSDTKWIEVGGPFNSVIHVPSHTGAYGGESSTRLSRRSATAVVSAGTMRQQSSFHKVLVHRLADRFRIIRENGIVLEHSIRLRKLPTSVIPAVLLQHAVSSIVPKPSKQEKSSSPSSSSTPTLVSSSGTTTKTKSKSSAKMKIMIKRSSSSSLTNQGADNNNSSKGKSKGNNNTRSNRRTAGNVSDREKAYAEARARILGKTEEDEDAANDTTKNNESVKKSQTPIADVDAVFPARRPEDTTNSSNDGGANGGKNSNGGSSSNLAAKAVLRNYEEEAKDPDFQRNHLPMPVTTSQLVPSQVWST
mmetsp:Transcript_14542/g.20547  ORF Transcript_14542/g.20547 Transcript_14542/m.20547 type:complete len:360 (+) Transcript_14542:161-1240(+)